MKALNIKSTEVARTELASSDASQELIRLFEAIASNELDRCLREAKKKINKLEDSGDKQMHTFIVYKDGRKHDHLTAY